MDDGPDIIATTPGGNIGVVECTTGLLNAKDKLIKLAQRTVLIKEQLNRTGHGYLFVLPIIVTALPKSEVEAGLEQAGENRIALVDGSLALTACLKKGLVLGVSSRSDDLNLPRPI